jgi:uncharacterized radical SAM superfamily protein
MDEATAAALANPIDFVSLEIPATETIREVFGLDATTADYVATYQRLRAAGMHVVPHISVYDGGEDQLLEAIVDLPHPETIVVIVFSPTRGTPMAEAAAPSPDVVGGVVARLVAAFPKTEITLGCMRPRTKAIRGALELAALDAGVSRMELPSRETLAVAKARGYEIVRFDACCALPRALEARARHLAHA